MTTRRSLSLSAAAASGVSACGFLEQSWTLKYKIKVRIFAGGQLHEGYSVVKTRYTRNPKYVLNRYDEYDVAVWGEAVCIDMGSKGLLFGVMDPVPGVSEAPYWGAFAPSFLTKLLPEGLNTFEDFKSGRVFEALRSLKGEQRLPPYAWPGFVYFSNLRDLHSAMVVPIPGRTGRIASQIRSESLTSLFGQDTRFESVTIKMTNDFVTHRIRSKLPWLKHIKGSPGHKSYTRNYPAPLGDLLLYKNFKVDGHP